VKKWLGRKKFSKNVAIKEAVNSYFSGLEKTYFSDGMNGLEKRWTKCITLRENYVEE